MIAHGFKGGMLDRLVFAGLMFRSGRGLLDELHLAIDAQNLRHLLLELRVAAFQVIADFVRLYLLLIEYVAQRALSQLGKAGMPLRRTMLTHMTGKKSRRPHFVGITEFLGLAARDIHNPCLGLSGNRRLFAGPRPIIERRQRTIGQRPLNAALDSLMVNPRDPSHLKKGWVFPVSQQHPRPLDPARRLRSRAGYRAQRRQILLANCQFNRLPPRRHELNPCSFESSGKLQATSGKRNPAHMICFKESMN